MRGNPQELSAREKQVLFFLVAGETQKEIAAILNLSAKTVNTFVMQLLRKTGLKSVNRVVYVEAAKKCLAIANECGASEVAERIKREFRIAA